MRFLPLISLLLLLIGYKTDLMAQKPTGFKISGGANASIRYYTATKNFDSRAPFMLQINAQPLFFYKNWRIPTRLALGNAQTSYRDFSRYGMTPENEKIRIFIGHNSPAWSPLVLQNRPILGLGFELKPGTLRLGLFAGRVQRAGLRDTFRNRVFAPQFTRNMAALQLGYGKQENQILLTFLMGSDNQNSLDSASKIGLPASNNGIFSLQATRSLGNLSAAAEASFSAFTQNKNLNTSEYNSFSVVKLPGLYTQTNASTTFAAAYRGEIKYIPGKKTRDSKPGGLVLNMLYDRIEPGYQSMGLYFLVNDIERVRLGLQHGLLKGKLNVQFQFGWEHNDLLNMDFIKNKRTIFSSVINYKPGQLWSHSLNVQNYTVQLLVDGFDLQDSLFINQINRSYSYSTFGKLNADKNAPKLFFSVGFQGGKSVVSGTSTKNIGHSFISFRYTPQTNPGIWVLSPGFSAHRYNSAAFSTSRFQPSVLTDKWFKNQTLNLRFETGLQITFFNSKYINTAWRNSGFLVWNLNKKNVLQGGILFQQNFQKALNFREAQFELRYGLKF